MTIDVISENTTEQNGTSDGGGPYTGIIDATIWAAIPTTNDEGGNVVRVCAGDPTSSAEARGLISFDTGLDNITGPVTVNSATIYLNVGDQNSTLDMTVNAYDCLQAVNYTQATWNIYSTGNNWGTAGAKSSGTDFDATALATGDTGTSAPSYWVALTGSGLDQAVEDYINGDRTVLDLLLVAIDGTATDRKDILSENQTNYVTQRPELVVDYTAGGGGAAGPRAGALGHPIVGPLGGPIG